MMQFGRKRGVAVRRWGWIAAVLWAAPPVAVAAESYPFDGSWVRADRVCGPAAPSLRVYSGRDLTLAGGRCTIRKTAFGSGEWELFEECRRADKSGASTVERIRMVGADAMIIKRQVTRLKIPRGRRYVRCNPAQAKPPAAPPATAPPPHGPPPAAAAPAKP